MLCLQGGNWDPNSMRNLLGTPMGTALHPQLNGSANALSGLVGGPPGAPPARHPSDAGSEHNLSLHNLRSKSPWEGAHGTLASLLSRPQLDHCTPFMCHLPYWVARRPTVASTAVLAGMEQ